MPNLVASVADHPDHSLLRRVHVRKHRFQPVRPFFHIVVGPEVHEKQSWLIIEGDIQLGKADRYENQNAQ